MKKNIIGIICVVLMGIFILASRTAPSRNTQRIYIKELEDKSAFQLSVNNRPYIIKGVVYSPVPIGMNHAYDFWSDPVKPHLYDARLMKEAGVNTIRVYRSGGDPLKTKEVMGDFYNKFGIRVAMGHWLGFWDNPNYADRDFCERVKRDVLDMVETYKDEEGILCWILGNENNMSFFRGHQSLNFWTTKEIELIEDPSLRRQKRAEIYYAFVNEVGEAIHKIDPNHPVILANAELTDLDAAGDITPDIDAFGCSIYRGKAFGSFFRQASMKLGKPLMIIEFGCDRYDAFLDKEDQDVQAEFIDSQWNEIEKNTFKGTGVGNSLGGFIFEWTDEWWKANEDNVSSWSIHDTTASWSNGSYYFDIKAPKNFNINEEWWGICSVEKRKNDFDERNPTKAYFVLKELWK